MNPSIPPTAVPAKIPGTARPAVKVDPASRLTPDDPP
jgi:hypothetical protein